MPISEFLTQSAGEDKLSDFRKMFKPKTLEDCEMYDKRAIKNGELQKGEKLEIYVIYYNIFPEGVIFVFRDNKLSSVIGDPREVTKKGHSWYFRG